MEHSAAPTAAAEPDPIPAALQTIFGGLRAVLGMWGMPTAITLLIHRRVGLVARQIERLLQRFRAGRLRAATPRAAAGARKPRQQATAAPRRFGWLLRFGKHHAAGYGSQLQAVLNQPEMAALLVASPQAVRLLRPLCRALAVDLPWCRPQPPRPPKPRQPRRPRPLPDLGRIPLPRGALTWARKQGFGKW